MTHVNKVLYNDERHNVTDSSLESLQKKVVEDENYIKPETVILEEDDVVVCPEQKQNIHASKLKIIKVKTVRDIRFEYEKYVYEYLKPDLLKQRQILYDRIVHGALREETLNIVNRILSSKEPITRTTWNMITNLNPNNFLYKKQYVISNGLKIKVNGSLGGSKEIIYKDNTLQRTIIDKNKLFRRKSLLFNTNLPKFKPGPLSKKYLLDKSHQIYNIGRTELVKLPNVGLEITPLYGAVLEPRIANYIHGKREENGILTDKWVEFAASAVGTIVNEKVIQCSKDTRVTFNLEYKNNQKRILMRNCNERESEHVNVKYEQTEENKSISEIVASVVENMIESVSISAHQDDIDYDFEVANEAVQCLSESLPNLHKVKKNSELERLDVTIIRLAEDTEYKTCQKQFCKLGCICSSLQCRIVIREHCGREDCMFKCKCNYSKSNENDLLDSNSQLINLNNKLHSRLAKEEQKFQQTVLVSNDKSILLNSRKRNWHNSSHISSETSVDNGEIKELKVLIIPLGLENVQNFCMAHELYRCFCKNRFLESSYKEMTTENCNNSATIDDENKNEEVLSTFCEDRLPKLRRTRTVQYKRDRELHMKKNEVDDMDLDIVNVTYEEGEISTCARVMPYIERKYNSQYYKQSNANIKVREANDVQLALKLMKIVNCDNYTDESSSIDVIDIGQKVVNETKTTLPKAPHVLPYLTNEEKLKLLLEKHYKYHRKQIANGTYKGKLETPTPGKFCLYPWNDVLLRYKNKNNYFYVTTRFPFKIFLTIQPGLPNLNTCINLDEIRVSELHKYPESIKSLITGNEDKDKFCILYGQQGCWEVKGCAKKIYENSNDDHNSGDHKAFEDDSSCSFSIDVYNKGEKNKFFMLKIENSFREIRIEEKGCIVKRDLVTKSIKLAKLRGRPVRVSTESFSQYDMTRFGVYATPALDDSHVLVGPYSGLQEQHGITISTWDTKEVKETIRGFWIINNKDENGDVLWNPISYLNNKNVSEQEIKSLYEQIHEVDSGSKKNKPIKIWKGNTFYLMNSNGVVKPISANMTTKLSVNDGIKAMQMNNIPPILRAVRQVPSLMPIVRDKVVNNNVSNSLPVESSRSPCSQKTIKLTETGPKISPNKNIENKKVEQHLTVVISDDEDDDESSYIPVWFECVNIDNIGCLIGRKNKDNQVSFIFPKSEPSPFLEEQAAFKKINEILDAKLFIPAGLKMIWKTVENEKDVRNPILLKEEDYGPDLILTKEGIKRNSELAALINQRSLNTIQSKDIAVPSTSHSEGDDK